MKQPAGSHGVEITGPALGSCTIATLVLVALKLAGAVSWSWIWVFSPLWLPPAAAMTLFVMLAAVWMAAASIDKARRH